jgi:hypothetical protein
MSNATTNVERQLIKNGYRELFLYGDEAEKLWANGRHRKELEEIVENPKSPDMAKFLAAELLDQFGVPLKEKTFRDLARIYTSALKNTNAVLENDYQLSGNMWGYLYEHDDPGNLGERIIQFGSAGVPYLQELLNDDGPVLYEGSREATVGNEYSYRIKDFAAFYLSKITNIPITFYQDPEQRDAEIERFKKLLKEGGYGKK